MYKEIDRDERFITYEVENKVDKIKDFLNYTGKEYGQLDLVMEDIGKKSDYSRKIVGWGVVDLKKRVLILQGELS